MQAKQTTNWITNVEKQLFISGMGKEVENLISENTELLATKCVFNDSKQIFLYV